MADQVTANIINCTKEVLTSAEAAKYMGISMSYLYKLTMRQQIPHYKPMGKMCYFNRKELEQWLQGNRVAETFLDRLRIERDELHGRYVKAKNYLSSPLAEKQLTPREKGSLAAQVEFMRQYLLCVEERIKYAMEKLNDKKEISE